MPYFKNVKQEQKNNNNKKKTIIIAENVVLYCLSRFIAYYHKMNFKCGIWGKGEGGVVGSYVPPLIIRGCAATG